MKEKLDRFEAAMGAIAKITTDEPELGDARCPKCDATDFVRVADLYSEAVGRLEEQPDAPETVRVGGLTDRQIVGKFVPPRRKSAVGMAIVAAIPLGAGAYYVYKRFGDTIGQLSGIIAFVITTIVFMTTLRRHSDSYYHGRRRWNTLYMCRRCGQLVNSG